MSYLDILLHRIERRKEHGKSCLTIYFKTLDDDIKKILLDLDYEIEETLNDDDGTVYTKIYW